MKKENLVEEIPDTLNLNLNLNGILIDMTVIIAI